MILLRKIKPFKKEMKLDLTNSLLSETYKAVEVAGVKNGATHVEVRVLNGKVYVIEGALRPGGEGIFYQLFDKSADINFFKLFILSNIPQKYRTNYNCTDKNLPKKSYYFYNIPYKGSGRIKRIIKDTVFKDKFSIDVIDLKKKELEYLPPLRVSLLFILAGF